MIRWQLQLNESEFEQTVGDSEGQKSLQFMCAAVHGVTKSWAQPSDQMTTRTTKNKCLVNKCLPLQKIILLEIKSCLW